MSCPGAANIAKHLSLDFKLIFSPIWVSISNTIEDFDSEIFKFSFLS